MAAEIRRIPQNSPNLTLAAPMELWYNQREPKLPQPNAAQAVSL